MCPIGLVLKIHTPMNEVQFPIASITRCLVSSVSVLSRTLEPPNHTFPNTKCTTALYLPAQTVQTHTAAANKGTPTLKKLHQKIWKCHEILLCFQNIYYDKINKDLLRRTSKNLSFFKRDMLSMTTSKPPEDFYTAFPERNQVHGNLWEAEFCDSIHHKSDKQNPRTYYSWIPVNTIESNPVIAAQAEGLAGKALVYTGRSNLLKYRYTEIHVTISPIGRVFSPH